MISYAKIFAFLFLTNVAIQLVNISGVFPESWGSEVSTIAKAYENINTTISQLQNQNPQDILSNMGSYGYIMFSLIQLVLSVTILAPIYVGQTLNNIFASIGLPSGIGTLFTIITYFSFILWIVDVLRGREVGA